MLYTSSNLFFWRGKKCPAGHSVFIIERAAVPVVPSVSDDPTVQAVPADQTVSAVSSGTEGVPAAAEVGAEVVVNDVEVEEVLASTDAVPIAGDGGNIVGEAVQPRANDWSDAIDDWGSLFQLAILAVCSNCLSQRSKRIPGLQAKEGN